MSDIHPIHVTLAWEDYESLCQRRIVADEIAQFFLVKLLQSHHGTFRVTRPRLREVDEYRVEYLDDDGMLELTLRKVDESSE
jgi:hypothetical protein